MSDLSYIEAVVLGIVQGMTEFLPVSSSGHLVLTQKLFGLRGDTPSMLLFDTLTHIATLLSVLVVFAGTFRSFVLRLMVESRVGYPARRNAWHVASLCVIASVPTAIIGFTFKDSFERSFNSISTIGVALLITGTLLYVTGRLPRPSRGWRRFGWWRALLIGVAQGCAIMPGISRSGSTICVALALGIKRPWAAQFSFLIAVPAITGAGALMLKRAFELDSAVVADLPWGPIMVGAMVSFGVGIAALKYLISIVVRDMLKSFCWYCWALGIVVLVLSPPTV